MSSLKAEDIEDLLVASKGSKQRELNDLFDRLINQKPNEPKWIAYGSPAVCELIKDALEPGATDSWLFESEFMPGDDLVVMPVTELGRKP